MAIEKVIDIKVQGNAEQAVGSLRSQLREAQAEVAALSDKFGATSAEAVKAAQKAAELKDRIGDAKALTDAFNPDAKFKALTSSLAGVAGGFAAAQGGMALFGIESENVQATLLKVQSAMALSQGIQAVGESVDSFKQLSAVVQSSTTFQKINSAVTAAAALVQRVFAGAVDTTAMSFQALKAAIVSTGIGALVVGIGYLISKMNEGADAAKELTKEQKLLNQQLEYTKELSADAAKLIDYQTQRELANAKERGASDKELTRIKIDGINARIENNAKEIDKIKSTKNEEYELTKEQNKRIQELRNQNIDLLRQGNLEVANFEADQAVKSREAEKSNSEKSKAQRKKDSEDKLAQAKKDAEDLKAALKNQQDAYKASYDKVTEAISEAQDKQSEFLVSAQEAEEQKIKDHYFGLIELAIQQGRTKEEIQVLQDQRDNEINDIRLKAQEKKYAQDKEAADKEVEIEKQKEAAKKEIRMQGLESVASIGQSLQVLAGKNKDVARAGIILENAAGIAKIIVNTMVANTKAAAAFPLTAGMPFTAVNTAAGVLSIAASIKATQTALSKIGSGGDSGGGSPSLGTMGAGGGASTAPQFNVVGSTGVNQLAGVMGAQQQTPVQTYVVANNVSTAMALDRNIIQSATLGG
jgi:hypothetical protein